MTARFVGGVIYTGGVARPDRTPPDPCPLPTPAPLSPPGGGGVLRYWMATHCQTATQSGGDYRQNLRAVNPVEGEKRGDGQL